MRNWKWAGIVLAAACASFGPAQDKYTISVEHETSWNSRYIWRGLVANASPNTQSDSTLYLGPLWLNVWSIGRTMRPVFGLGSDEVDVTLGWDTSLGGISVSPHVIYYSFAPGSGQEDTTEAGVTASAELGGFTLFTNHYLDVSAVSGSYYGEAGVTLAREFGEIWSSEATVSIGWANRKFNAFNHGVHKKATNAITGEFSLTYQVAPDFYIRPYAIFTHVLDRDLRTGSGSKGDQAFGIAFGFAG